jgi:hypothetical protein
MLNWETEGIFTVVFKVLPRYLPEETEETHENPQFITAGLRSHDGPWDLHNAKQKLLLGRSQQELR